MQRDEEWRTAPGYEGRYEVSDLGRVRRVVRIGAKTACVLAPTLRNDGYLVVGLSDNSGRKRNWLVHRLVLTAFAGERPPSVHAAHLDGTRANNALRNLRWCTPRENESHKRAHGRTLEGEKNGCARLTAEIVARIRAEYRPRSPHAGLVPLARRYGVSMQHVSDIVRGNRWNHTITTRGQ